MTYRFTLRSEPYRLDGYPDWMAALLHARGISTPQEADAFLHPDLTMLHDPQRLHGVPEAVWLIRKAQAEGWRTVVYGDYDVDGLCAATILNDGLHALGIDTSIYIPDRHSEGYGMHEEAIRALAAGTQLLITVDCGIANHTEVALARALGMRVIITDHHTPSKALPEADAIVHPMLGDYPFRQLCGAGTAWKLVCALLGTQAALASLDLAALATIADMVPLLGENRVIAAFGLTALAATVRPGLRQLMEVAGIGRDGTLSADRVSFGIAPRLNAAGRLKTAQDALCLLNTKNEIEARRLALELDALNGERRGVQDAMLAQAETMLTGVNLAQVRTIVLAHPAWNKGVAGLVAGKLAEQHAYPTIILAGDGDTLTGSGRSAGDVDLYGALNSCAAHLLTFGGHRQAAGLSMSAEALPAFRAAFEQAVRVQVGDDPLVRRVYYDAEVPLAHVGRAMVTRLAAFAPFGMGNPTPLMLCRDVRLRTPRAVGNGRHLKVDLVRDAARLDGIYFGMGDPEALPPEDADVVFEPAINRYGGTETVQAIIRATRAGTQAFPDAYPNQPIALLQDFDAMTANNEVGMVYPPAVSRDDFDKLQGLLLFCRTRETAQTMHERYPDYQVFLGKADDPKALNAVVYAASLSGITAPYSTVILCDGCLSPGEAALPSIPGVMVKAMPVSEAFQSLIQHMRVSTDDLRLAYVALRNNDLALGAVPITPLARLAALYILKQMALIDFPAGKPYASRLLPVRKIDPAGCPLYRFLNP